jgi:thymidylate synthase
MITNEQVYLDQLRKVREYGVKSSDRTGTGTLRYPGLQMRYDLTLGFPALTTKKLLFYPMLIELLWLLQGRTDIQWLTDRKCNIWTPWADENNSIGKGYGYQWRNWNKNATHSVDQIRDVIHNIKTDPDSRRHIVSAWNVAQLDEMALPPCHFSFQFVVINGQLNTILYQRSADMFLGVPFNIASYALLTHLIAVECGLVPGTLVHNIGDAHIYSNHLEQVDEQLSREPYANPELVLDDSIFLPDWGKRGLLYWIDNHAKNLELEDFKKLFYLDNYKSHPYIKAPIAV